MSPLQSPASTRKPVVPTTNATVINSNTFTVLANNSTQFLLEVGSVTTSIYDLVGMVDLIPVTAPPSTVASYVTTMGHLLDIFAFTNSNGIEVRIEQAVVASAPATYRRVATYALTPGVASPINAFRITTFFTRLVIANTSGTVANVDFSAITRSM